MNKNNLEKHYRELEQIIKESKTSARIRFMIQDLMELRHAAWVARRAEAKPMTIDEIHEEARVKRLQQERDQERDRQQRRDPNRQTVIGTAYSGGNQQQYNDSRGSRGSGIRTQNNRNDDDRVENRFNVNSVRQLQSNDRRGQGPMTMNLAPQRTWARGSGVEKKAEEDPSFAARGAKPPAGPVQQLKGKAGSSQEGASGYPLQRQSSRELARENSHRDRENALLSLRKTTTGSGINSPGNAAVGGGSSMANSREGSRNVSREQSRNASRESSVSERTSNASLTARISKTSALDSSTIINADPSETSFDEEKTQARVHALIEEYTENYSESSDRPVKVNVEIPSERQRRRSRLFVYIGSVGRSRCFSHGESRSTSDDCSRIIRQCTRRQTTSTESSWTSTRFSTERRTSLFRCLSRWVRITPSLLLTESLDVDSKCWWNTRLTMQLIFR